MNNAARISTPILIAILMALSIIVSACQSSREGGTMNGRGNGAPSFEKTYWKLVELAEGGAVTDSGSAEAHMIFGSDSTVTGRTGCNHMSGRYMRSGDALTFTPLITTKMACPATMELEQRFLAALGSTRRWKIDNGRLELYDGGGRMVARFEPRDRG